LKTINSLLNLFKSEAAQSQESLELGSGYSLILSGSMAASITDRAAGYSVKDLYEVRHAHQEGVVAGLDVTHGEEVSPIVKVGVNLDAPGVGALVPEILKHLKAKYSTLPDTIEAYLKSAWGYEEPQLAASINHTKIMTVLNSLSKSEGSQMFVRVTGHKGWHKLKDIKDSGIPAHQGGGNHYTFEHGKTGEHHTVHQSEVEDLATEKELTQISYMRKFKKNNPQVVAKSANLLAILDVAKSQAPGMLLGSLNKSCQSGTCGFSGQPAMLMFRGMAPSEEEICVKEGFVQAPFKAVWSPFPDAMYTEQTKLVGCWIATDKIESQKNPEEFVVLPHKSSSLNEHEIQQIISHIEKGPQDA
jgi:hypothetical protein